ncbi:MAG: tripartite tricarboxylate transporter substrate binding protein [Rhodoferax sp.]|nr:tripartite tricarboxylate transporter substrate binding protein [Rhodoferax sp.]MCB2008382.1 tripartite tricarboxylate transporter substrate binding protein [Rhodoferax sp.]MCB2029258.1 tripartite tricarboxylate transporter substrate binding protein [Rhodoferax sp.]
MQWLRFATAILATTAALALSQGASAQITRIIVGGPPGGNTDIAARLVADKLGRQLGGSVVIENKPGAGGTLAAELVKNARPDGLTIGLITVSNATNETLQASKSYSLLTDLEPVGLYAWLSNVLIIHPSISAATVPELVTALKTKSLINFSSGGIGSPGHLSGETFKRMTGLPMTHIPYKGAPPAVLAVVTNEVSLMFSTASAALPQIKGKTVRPIAVTSNVRLAALPDVPTFLEAGLTHFDVRDWIGFVVPKGTPIDVRERLHRAFATAFADPELVKRFEENTMVMASPPLAPAAFGEFLAADVAKWAKVIKEAGIQPQ